jgi:hypothetical protein
LTERSAIIEVDRGSGMELEAVAGRGVEGKEGIARERKKE